MRVAKVDIQIPESSVLHSFARRGLEGGCVLCHQPVSTHIGEQGQWIGCSAQSVPPDTLFLLIPDRRKAALTVPKSLERRGTTVRVPVPLPDPPATSPRATQPRGSRVVYHLGLDKPRVIASLPETDARVYAVIARRPKQGASRLFLLQQLAAEQRTGIVDGAVRRLRLKGLVKAEAA